MWYKGDGASVGQLAQDGFGLDWISAENFSTTLYDSTVGTEMSLDSCGLILSPDLRAAALLDGM